MNKEKVVNGKNWQELTWEVIEKDFPTRKFTAKDVARRLRKTHKREPVYQSVQALLSKFCLNHWIARVQSGLYQVSPELFRISKKPWDRPTDRPKIPTVLASMPTIKETVGKAVKEDTKTDSDYMVIVEKVLIPTKEYKELGIKVSVPEGCFVTRIETRPAVPGKDYEEVKTIKIIG